MSFRLEVLVKKQAGSEDTEWREVAPVGGQPYEWETFEEADKHARMCYPDQYRLGNGVRVVSRTRLYDPLPDCLIIDGTTESTREELVAAYQRLINSGIIWSLQGTFGRTAQGLIESGECEGTLPWKTLPKSRS